jgi:DNA replication and repair protein RecF
MSFESVRLTSFRNLGDAEIGTSADRIFMIGENGQGKTNFLEALYYLSYASSFRGPVDGEAARRGATSFCLQGRMRSPLGHTLDEIRVLWEAKAKDIRRNGKPIKDRKELVELNPAIVFCHEDYAFAAGEPERRRYFFDQAASLVSAGYLDSLREYKRVLRQRNATLKEKRQELLDMLDLQLAEAGLELMAARIRLRDEFRDRISQRYEAVSLLGEELLLNYKPSWSVSAEVGGILERLAGKRLEELAFGTSLSGPHRDRWTFDLGGRDFTATASTGQLRLLSLSLRMVQAEYYTAATERLPVLLLDDVLLELDRGKRQRFLELLPRAAQAFFTFLPGENWEEYSTSSTLVYEVRDGRFEN